MNTHPQHLSRAYAGRKIGVAGKNDGGGDGPVLRQRQQIGHEQPVDALLLAVGIERAVTHLDVIQTGKSLMLFRQNAARVAPVIPVNAQKRTIGKLVVNGGNERLAHLGGVDKNIFPFALFAIQQIGKLHPEITGIHKGGDTLHTILPRAFQTIRPVVFAKKRIFSAWFWPGCAVLPSCVPPFSTAKRPGDR